MNTAINTEIPASNAPVADFSNETIAGIVDNFNGQVTENGWNDNPNTEAAVNLVLSSLSVLDTIAGNVCGSDDSEGSDGGSAN